MAESETSELEGTSEETRPAPSPAVRPAQRRNDRALLTTERGTTRIADGVVETISALAAREIPGVASMGKSFARAFGAIRSRVPGVSEDSSTQGVAVEVGERQAAVDIDLVVYYGQSIVEVTEAVRANVIDRIESMTGLEVTEVNIAVDDLDTGDGGSGAGPSRVE